MAALNPALLRIIRNKAGLSHIGVEPFRGFPEHCSFGLEQAAQSGGRRGPAVAEDHVVGDGALVEHDQPVQVGEQQLKVVAEHEHDAAGAGTQGVEVAQESCRGRRVEAGGQLVAHEHAGPGQQRSSEGGAAQLAAGELRRGAVHLVGVVPEQGQLVVCLLAGVGRAESAQVDGGAGDLVQDAEMLLEGLAALLPDVLHRRDLRA